MAEVHLRRIICDGCRESIDVPASVSDEALPDHWVTFRRGCKPARHVCPVCAAPMNQAMEDVERGRPPANGRPFTLRVI